MAQPVKYQGVDKESSGYKLLAAMGWQEGNGLVRPVFRERVGRETV